MAQVRVTDLTVDEFRILVKEIVKQTMHEILSDPDEGMDLREDVEARLRRSLAEVKTGVNTIPAQEVAAKLGLEW